MIREYDVRVIPQVAACEQNLAACVADEYGFDRRTVKSVRV